MVEGVGCRAYASRVLGICLPTDVNIPGDIARLHRCRCGLGDGCGRRHPKEISGELKKYYQMLLSEKVTYSDARTPIKGVGCRV